MNKPIHRQVKVTQTLCQALFHLAMVAALAPELVCTVTKVLGQFVGFAVVGVLHAVLDRVGNAGDFHVFEQVEVIGLVVCVGAFGPGACAGAVLDGRGRGEVVGGEGARVVRFKGGGEDK